MQRFLDVRLLPPVPRLIADVVYAQEKKDKAMEDKVSRKHSVDNITIDQIDIVGLQHVSTGSWQAHLRLRPRT